MKILLDCNFYNFPYNGKWKFDEGYESKKLNENLKQRSLYWDYSKICIFQKMITKPEEKILKRPEYNPNAKKKKNCNDSNIYNKKLEIKEIYWENILTKFSKSNSYDHATIFDLCQ